MESLGIHHLIRDALCTFSIANYIRAKAKETSFILEAPRRVEHARIERSPIVFCQDISHGSLHRESQTANLGAFVAVKCSKMDAAIRPLNINLSTLYCRKLISSNAAKITVPATANNGSGKKPKMRLAHSKLGHLLKSTIWQGQAQYVNGSEPRVQRFLRTVD